MKRPFLFLLLLFVVLQSCKLFYPNRLLRSDKDYYYYELGEKMIGEQTIEPTDRFTLQVYARKGYDLVDVLNQGGGGGQRQRSGGGGISYRVEKDGFAELPVLGRVKVDGLKKLELEELLENKYAKHFNDPYIILEIINRKVLFFPGEGDAQVIELPEEKTTLLELIAIAGGIPKGSKSHKIRLLRGDYANPKIKQVDLSKISGMEDASIIVKDNDIVVVEPTSEVIPSVLQELNPILSLISTLTTFYVLITNLGN